MRWKRGKPRPLSPKRYPPVGKSRPGRVDYFWVLGKYEGQNFLNGPHNDKDDAYQWGYQNIEGDDFEVITLPTRDMKRANQIVRQRNIDGGQNIGDVLRRTKHKF